MLPFGIMRRNTALRLCPRIMTFGNVLLSMAHCLKSLGYQLAMPAPGIVIPNNFQNLLICMAPSLRTDACRPAPWVDASMNWRPLFERSELGVRWAWMS
jgi:hypothetical protein